MFALDPQQPLPNRAHQTKVQDKDWDNLSTLIHMPSEDRRKEAVINKMQVALTVHALGPNCSRMTQDRGLR